jgi:hypothetical protein
VSAGASLVCPGCGREHPGDQRFCATCGMPLVLSAASPGEEQPAGELRRRARKIKPQYAEGAPVKVVGARNQTEADFIQSLLLEEGIPSMARRSRGFDVPDFLAAGPRDVMVPESSVLVAREVLLQSELISTDSAQRTGPIDAPWRVMAWLLAGLVAVALLVVLVVRL